MAEQKEIEAALAVDEPSDAVDEPTFTVKTKANQVSVSTGVYKDGDKVSAYEAEQLRVVPSVEVTS